MCPSRKQMVLAWFKPAKDFYYKKPEMIPFPGQDGNAQKNQMLWSHYYVITPVPGTFNSLRGHISTQLLCCRPQSSTIICCASSPKGLPPLTRYTWEDSPPDSGMAMQPCDLVHTLDCTNRTTELTHWTEYVNRTTKLKHQPDSANGTITLTHQPDDATRIRIEPKHWTEVLSEHWPDGMLISPHQSDDSIRTSEPILELDIAIRLQNKHMNQMVWLEQCEGQSGTPAYSAGFFMPSLDLWFTAGLGS